MNNVIAILASILMGISFPTGLFELLIVGRFLIGINSGVGICVQPLYLGEVAPKHLRGGMAMGSSIFLTGGILTGQIIGLRLEMHFVFLPRVTRMSRIPVPCRSLQNIHCG